MPKEWTPEQKKYLRENIEKKTFKEIGAAISKTELAVQLYIHRNKIPVGRTVVRNLVQEILTLKFIHPEYFHPTRGFYEAVKLTQKRWWDLYFGRAPITEDEYVRLIEHFCVSLTDAFEARQLNLFEQ
jgi:hypothetical protein